MRMWIGGGGRQRERCNIRSALRRTNENMSVSQTRREPRCEFDTKRSRIALKAWALITEGTPSSGFCPGEGSLTRPIQRKNDDSSSSSSSSQDIRRGALPRIPCSTHHTDAKGQMSRELPDLRLATTYTRITTRARAGRKQ